jgi:hypothetical protein
VSSRLARDAHGRLVVEVTTSSPGLDVGDRFVVLGDSISVSAPDDPGGFAFLGTVTGRVPAVEEAARLRVGGARLPTLAPTGATTGAHT